MDIINLLVAGSRTIADKVLIEKYIFSYLEELCIHVAYDTIRIVSGGAKGVDTIAKEIAIENGIQPIVIPALWDHFGKSAGFKRNIHLVDIADYVLILHDGKSIGTKNTIDLCKRHNKPFKYVIINKE